MPAGIQTTSTLTYARWAKYLPDYIRAASFERLYDSLAMGNVIPDSRMQDLWRSSSINLEFLSDIEPGTQTIPEALDVIGNTMQDATFQITGTSRWGLVEASELLMNSSGTDYAAERYYALGKHHMQTIDLIAQTQALTGSNVVRAAARASLDAGTAAHSLAYANFTNATVNLQDKQVPGFRDNDRSMWFAIMHPFAFADLRNSTPILQTAQYQKANIIFKYELGELGPFKLVVSPNAKVFYAAGAANASAIATTLNGAVAALAKTIVVAANTNIDVGDYIMIGTAETGDTHYYNNERVSVTSVSGTTIGVSGGGANGGLKYAHETAATVSNRDNVIPIVFGGPRSLAKVYDPQTGEYGEVLPPKRVGALEHVYQLGWKWYGNYSRWNESMITRQEVAATIDA